MRKLLVTILALSSSLVFGAPVWTEYMFKVDNPDSAAKIIAAADAFMASDYSKESFKGSVHLNTYMANGDNQATHAFAVLQPSLEEHANWTTSNADPNNEAASEFFKIYRENSEPVTERINTFLSTFGTPSNNDRVWMLHQMKVKPSDYQKVIKACENLDRAIKDSFPGQFGVSEATVGGDEVNLLLTVGFESVAEMEAWEDSSERAKTVAPFLRALDSVVDWKGSTMVVNTRVYDSASDLTQFVTKDFEE